MPWKQFMKKCEQCKNEFLTSRSNPKARFCSDRCRGDAKMGSSHPNYKGGHVHKSNGYKSICVNGKKYFEHRYVMEQHLGRPLTSKEHVHHINGNRTDNRIENLELHTALTHARKHMKLFFNDTHKQCSDCLEVKLHSEFYKRTTRPMGLQSKCKTCTLQWHANRPKRDYKAEKQRRLLSPYI